MPELQRITRFSQHINAAAFAGFVRAIAGTPRNGSLVVNAMTVAAIVACHTLRLNEEEFLTWAREIFHATKATKGQVVS
jgi:hypothetical protein